MLITRHDLELFTNTFPDEEDNQLDLFCGASEDIVKNYLRYDPELKTYDLFINGSGTTEVHVPAKPIIEIIKVAIDGTEFSVEDLRFEEDVLFTIDGTTFPKGTRNIHLQFKAGFETIPEIIKLTSLRIAGLLSTEVGNVGITSKSFQDSGSRTFVNTTNFDKYLLQISRYRLLG